MLLSQIIYENTHTHTQEHYKYNIYYMILRPYKVPAVGELLNSIDYMMMCGQSVHKCGSAHKNDACGIDKEVTLSHIMLW